MMALGEYPMVSLAQARERHFSGRKMLAGGLDPMAERKAEIKANKGKPKRNSVKRKPLWEDSPQMGEMVVCWVVLPSC
jgi:Arm DNA-binding domain